MEGTTNDTGIKREMAHETFYKEMEALKLLLPKDWRIRFFLKNKQYDTAGGGRLVSDVYYCRTTDTVVFKLLKEISDIYQEELKYPNTQG